jgi:NAD(P)-dependent dehydrogenase (short-subunit alcohol dehydrogenase family)
LGGGKVILEDQKTALITGASGGIGQSLCSVFRNDGYKVIALDCTEKLVDADFFIESDLDKICSDNNYCLEILSHIQSLLTNSHGLDVLINNAAIQVIKPMEKISVADWNQTLNVNLITPFLLTQKLFSFLAKARGSVVNISSIHAKLTKPEFICYATSKTALVGLTKSMAVELGSKVRINAICPAAVSTPMLLAGFDGKGEAYKVLSSMHPLGRIAEPAEVARLALFLASKDAQFINGASLELDGGIGSRLHDPV